MALSSEQLERYSRHIILKEEEAAEREGPHHWGRRARIARRHVSGRGRCGNHRHRGRG